MGPVQATKTCLRKYFQFSGRAARSEYWWFFAVTIVLVYGSGAIGLSDLSSIFWLLTLIPWLAVSWRRMHDSNLAGPWILLPAAIVIIAIYGFLFSQLAKVTPALTGIEVSDDTTFGQWRNMMAGRQMEMQRLLSDWSAGDVAAILFGISGVVLAIYLKTRPSTPGQNRFGHSPDEVPQ